MTVNKVISSVEALDLRRRGYSYREIGAKLGCCHATALKHVTEALANAARERNLKAADLLQIDLERLDVAIAGLMPAVMKGDPKSVTAMMRVMERRAKLLGMDSPTKVEASGPDGGPIELGLDASKDHVLKLVERYAEKAAAQAAAAAVKES